MIVGGLYSVTALRKNNNEGHKGGERLLLLSWAKAGKDSKGRSKATRSDDWCLLFVLIRHGEEGATSLHAGLERLGKETGEPTGPLGPTP